MTQPDPRQELLDEKDQEIARLSRRVEQLMEIMERMTGHHLLPFGRRVDDPPPEGPLGALRFRLGLAARKHPVVIAATLVALVAAAFLGQVLQNEKHFGTEDTRLSSLAHNGLRNGVLQAGQRAVSIRLLCNIDTAVVKIINTSLTSSKATELFISQVEAATGATLKLPPLKARVKLTRQQIKPLVKANCPRQERLAVRTFNRAMDVYLTTLPRRERDAERRRLIQGVQK